MKILDHNLYTKVYPNCPHEIPDELLSEKHSATIHGQSINQLNKRGGMSPAELALNLERQFDIHQLRGDKEAIQVLILVLEKYVSKL